MGKALKEENVPQFLDRRAAAEYIGLSDHWLAKHKGDHDAPPYIKFGRKCWYRRLDLMEWVKERKARIDNADSHLNNIWMQSSERKTMAPSLKDLENEFEHRFGPDSPNALIAEVAAKLKRVPSSKLKELVNTLNRVVEGWS